MKSEELKNLEYNYGFTTEIENFKAPRGLSEETINFISKIIYQFFKRFGISAGSF